MIRAAIIWCLLSCFFISKAQDYRLSQWYNAPLLLNPSLTGHHDKDFRANLNYKDQWSSISNSFTTVAGSFDMPMLEDVEGINKMGIGLSFINDKAGTTNYGFTNMNLSAAYHTKTTRFSQLSGGLMIGYGQSQADLNSVKWENQHNGNNYDPSLSSGESVFVDQIRYIDVGLGVNWSHYDRAMDQRFDVGLSVTHTNFPNHSFIGQNQDRLRPKFQLYSMMDFGFESWMLRPKVLIQNQGPAYAATIGAMARFRTSATPDSRFTDAYVSSAFEVGMHYRFNESVIFAAQYEYKKRLLIALSYDIIVSQLSSVSNAGGVELGLRYQGLFKNERIKIKNQMDGGNKKSKKPGGGKKSGSDVRM